MSKLSYVEPAANGSGPVEVYVYNPDEVGVMLETEHGTVHVAFWQLDRIVKRVRAEFAFQLDREEREQNGK